MEKRKLLTEGRFFHGFCLSDSAYKTEIAAGNLCMGAGEYEAVLKFKKPENLEILKFVLS